MKYAQYILKHVIPEWGFMYLNYSALKKYFTVSGALKKFLILAKKTKNSQEYQIIKKSILQMSYLMSKIESDNKEFQNSFVNEVNKILYFKKTKYNDLKGKTFKLQIQIQSMRKIQNDINEKKKRLKTYNRKNKDKIYENLFLEEQIKHHDLQNICMEFEENKKILQSTCYKLYNEGIYFEKYLMVNSEAVRKIQKKYSKKMLKCIKQKFKDKYGNAKQLIEELKINQTIIKVKQLLFQVEKILIQNYYKKNPKQCRQNLRKYQVKIQNKQKTWFVFGMFSGFCLMLVIILIFIALDGHVDPVKDQLLYLFFPSCRGILLFMIYYQSLAILVWQWNKQKINYKQVLEFNHHFSTLDEILKRIMILSAFFLLILLIYVCQLSDLGKFISDIQLFDPNYLPTILWFTFIIFLFYPSKIQLNGEGRLWIFSNLLYPFKLKCQSFKIKHIFVMTQLTSLIVPFTDFNYTVCQYYHSIVENENDTNYECFIKARYVTLAIGILPHIVILYEELTQMIRTSVTLSLSLDVLHFFLSIIQIITSILTYSYRQLFYVWTVLAFINIILLLIIAYIDLSYLKNKIDKAPSLKNLFSFQGIFKFRILMIIYAPMAILYPFSISTILLGIILDEEHGYTILWIGIIEIIRSIISIKLIGLFVNFFIIDQEHTKNLKNYTTVGNYIFPFQECSQQIRQTLIQYDDEDSSLYSKPGLELDLEDKQDKLPILTQQRKQSFDAREIVMAVQNQPDSVQSNLFQSTRQVMNLNEIVRKDSEKALGQSFLNFDIANYHEDSVESYKQFCVSELDNSQFEQVISTNELYKKEINYLTTKYKIKKP